MTGAASFDQSNQADLNVPKPLPRWNIAGGNFHLTKLENTHKLEKDTGLRNCQLYQQWPVIRPNIAFYLCLQRHELWAQQAVVNGNRQPR